MTESKKPSEFTVTDRRRFTSEGEVTSQPPDEESREARSPEPVKAPAAPPLSQAAPGTPNPPGAAPDPRQVPPPSAADVEAQPEPFQPASGVPDPRTVPPPSAADRQATHDAFKESNKQLDAQLRSELGGRRQDFEMSFERFVVSFYMSALVHLGLMAEQGTQPMVDLLGARQTIDTLGMLADKTKGNLTMSEDNLIQNCLYELRMAYVEVTNAIARGPQTPGAPPPPGGLNIK